MYLIGKRFSYGIAAKVRCRFGTQVVEARAISTATRLQCATPPLSVAAPTKVAVEVSVDDINFFGNPALSFTYTLNPVFNAGVQSIVPSAVGSDRPYPLVIVGTKYPPATLLAPGFPICRFAFSKTSEWQLTHGSLSADSQTLTCPSPSGTPDPNVQVSVSFNGQEFFGVATSTPLRLVQPPSIVSMSPAYGTTRTPHLLSLSGQRLQSITLVGYEDKGSFTERQMTELAVVGPVAPEQAQVQAITFANVSTTGELWLHGDAAVAVRVANDHPQGFSLDQVVYQFLDRPVLKYAVPAVVTPGSNAAVIVRGSAFRATPALACYFGSLRAARAEFLNETAVACYAPAGAIAFGSAVELTVTLNGLQLVPASSAGALLLTVKAARVPSPTAVDPATIKVGDEDFVVDVYATGLLDTPWIRCRLDGLILNGTFHSDASTGSTFARCLVPSTVYLRATTGVAEGSLASVSVEIANDAQTFSAAGLRMQVGPSG